MVLLIVQKPTVSQNELFDDSKKDQRHRWLKAASSKWPTRTMVGTVRWSCCCHLRHAHDKMADGKTAYEKNVSVAFDGPSIPFGAKDSHKPIPTKDESRPHQFDNKMLPGIFVLHVLRAGRRGRSGDSLIADCGDVENLSAESRTRRKAVVPTCGRIFQTLRSSSTPHAAKRPPGRNPLSFPPLGRTVSKP